jgi:hypothetical protein
MQFVFEVYLCLLNKTNQVPKVCFSNFWISWELFQKKSKVQNDKGGIRIECCAYGRVPLGSGITRSRPLFHVRFSSGRSNVGPATPVVYPTAVGPSPPAWRDSLDSAIPPRVHGEASMWVDALLALICAIPVGARAIVYECFARLDSHHLNRFAVVGFIPSAVFSNNKFY